MINWNTLEDTDGLQAIINASENKPQLIFKHSTRCSISHMAKDRLERNYNIAADALEMHYLDLLNYRPVSNEIANVTGVEHESPQVLLIKDGRVVYHASHNQIGVAQIAAALQ